jgi:Fe-S-cluster containining protein
MDEDALRWAAYHGIRIVEQCGEIVVFIPNRCSKLNEDNTCSIYSDRPMGCVTTPSPTRREFQPPECRYFEEES